MNPLLVPIIIVAARSGGHIIPALTLAYEYDAQRPVYAITSDSALDGALVGADDRIVRHETIPFSAAPVRWYEYPWAFITFVWSLMRCILLFWQANPCLIINTGGAIGLPAACAARMLGIPFELHELNAVPGRATRYTARIAHSVYTVFPEAQRQLHFVGAQLRDYPIRYTDADKKSRVVAKEMLGIDPALPVVIVLGGSQGAERLNNAASRAVCMNESIFFVLHQAGKNAEQYADLYRAQKKNAQVHRFVDTKTLALWYSAADCAISRAGSGTIHELLFFQVPTVLVPLSGGAAEHQADNALAASRQYPELFISAPETADGIAQKIAERMY